MSSPRQAGSLPLKLFDGPGEPNAGLENARKRPFCPSSLVSFVFRIETPSGSSLCTVTGVQCRKLTSKNQKINEHWSPDEIRVWQTSMSLVFYIYQDFNIFSLLYLQDFNVFSLLQGLQCLQSHVLQDYVIFCLMISMSMSFCFLFWNLFFILKLICFELCSLFYGTPTNVQDE